MQVWALDLYLPSLPTRIAQTVWSKGQSEKCFLMELKNDCSGSRELSIRTVILGQIKELSRINSSLQQRFTKPVNSNPVQLYSSSFQQLIMRDFSSESRCLHTRKNPARDLLLWVCPYCSLNMSKTCGNKTCQSVTVYQNTELRSTSIYLV